VPKVRGGRSNANDRQGKKKKVRERYQRNHEKEKNKKKERENVNHNKGQGDPQRLGKGIREGRVKKKEPKGKRKKRGVWVCRELVRGHFHGKSKPTGGKKKITRGRTDEVGWGEGTKLVSDQGGEKGTKKTQRKGRIGDRSLNQKKNE